MKNFIINIITVINIIFIPFNLMAITNNKVIFLINNNPYTSLDMNQRVNYLKLLYGYENIEKINKLSLSEDFFNLMIYDEYYKLNIKNNIDKLIQDEYLNITKTLKKDFNKKNIINNIRYDLQRKIILEQKLEKEREYIFSNNINEVNNIYEIDITFLSYNEKDALNIEGISNINNLESVIKLLDENQITYIYRNKKLNFKEKINDEIKKAIIKNKKIFNFKINNNIIMGTIDRKFKITANLKLLFIELETNIMIPKNQLFCDNIKNLDQESIKITQMDIVNHTDLNESIKNNIKMINDYIIFESNNKNKYLILCKIEYDNKDIENINISNKIQHLAEEIETNFLKNYIKFYETQKYYE